MDNLSDINLDFGSGEGDTTMQNLTYILRQISGTSAIQNFRLEGGVFAVFYQMMDREECIEHSNLLRNTIYDSEKFITHAMRK